LSSGSARRRVPDDRALLGYLRGLGLLPGAVVELVRRAPFPEPVIVSTGGAEHAISVELAGQIGVS
jgi:Fe2+ transport system protein FeoA